MQTITYPDGSQFTSTAFATGQEIQTVFQMITAQMLGYTASPLTTQLTLTTGSNVATVGSNLFLYVGQLVAANGLPTGTLILAINGTSITLSKNATVTGVQAGTVTDPLVWNKVRQGWQTQGQPGPDINLDTVTIRCSPIDTPYSRLRDNVGLIPEDITSTQQDVFTRTWVTYFIFYGPNSLSHAKAVQSALIKVPFVDSFLSSNNLYVNPSIREPLRTPELFQGEWWERVDLVAEFNEEITETFTVGTVASVEVKIYTKDGEVADFTVTT